LQTPGFNFGQTAAGGGLAKTASTPLFGGPTAFGAATTPSLFGASTGGAFSFSGAQQPQSTPSLFGAASAPAAGGFSFGGAPSGGAFGATGSPPLAFGGGGGFFGQPQQQQQQQQQNQLAPLFGAAGVAQAPDLSAIRELESIKDSFIAGIAGGPSNPRYRFQYLFLNVVEDPGQRIKPADVDELAWREALQKAGGPDNPEKLWPVLAKGFGDLLARRVAQEEALKEQTSRMEALTAAIATLASRQETLFRDRLEGIRKRHTSLAHQLLRLFRRIDALEGRFAGALGHRVSGLRGTVKALSDQLTVLEAEVAPAHAMSAGGGLRSKVEPLAAVARLQLGGGALGGSSISEVETAVDPAALQSLHDILSQCSAALGIEGDVVHRLARDVAVLELKTLGEDAIMS